MNKREIDEFRSASLEFEATGKYCKHDPNTISGKKFWIEQARRSVKGYHIGSDYISGYNYFYLNFSPIKKAKTDGDDTKARVRGSLSFDFPDWWDFDKLYFDYLEEAEAAGEHASVLKSRRKGYSFKGGSMCNRNYFLIPRSTSYVYASDKAYLIGDGGILSKAWDIMSFVDENTPWVKRRQASDTGLQKRSSYKVMENGTYIEKGFKSEIVGITIGGDWNRVRGKQAKLILWEEAGCHAKGTKVIMSDGTFKNVEDICVGDKLMGPDSKCRTVLELHSGKDDMYKITPKNGMEQIVNSKHPIYVEYQDYYKNSPVKMTMTAKDYLNIVKDTPKRKYHYSLTRPEIIEFNKQEVKIDPYLLGLWLGDGDSDTVIFTNIDKEVIDFLKDYAIQNDLECKITTSNKGTCFRIALSSGLRKNNWIRKELKNLGILGNKNIPDKYIYTDKESRLKLLAGLIDTDGSYSKKKKAIQISQHEKRKDIIFKAAYIARSLGMKVSIDTRITTDRKLKDHTIKGGELHYRLTILYGHEDIPCLIPRKKGIDRKGFLRNPLSTRFDITYYGFDDYYGFTLDKDHLFLTEDFTITHNTNPYLLKAYNAALPSLKQGNIVYGLSVSFGTGGSEGQDFMGLEELFFNPKGHEIHPMKNIWEDDELGGYCGFFHPEWANMDGYMDECGNSKKIEAIAAWEKELANIKEHARNPDAVVRFLAEHPIKPSQALLQSKHNEFPVIEIKKTLAKLMSSEQMQDAEFIGEFELDDVSGRYKWKPNPDLTPIKVFPLDLTGDNNAISIEGCWVIYEHPILDENNQVTWGRYIAGTDPVDDDRDDSLESESIQSTFVLDTWTDRIVAEYSGRPYNVETYYENLRRGLLYYNATCNYEQEKKGLYTYFKNKNSLHLLADNLEILSDRGISMFKGEGNRSKGTMGTHPVQKHGRDLIKTYLVNVSPGTEEVLNVHRIRSIPLLKELMYWNPEGNFDRVSALSMLMLYRAEKYRQISDRKVLIKSKLENSRILERNKVNSYGNFHKINQLFHKVTN